MKDNHIMLSSVLTGELTEAGNLLRCQRNPLIVPEQIPYPCQRVYNPAACKFGDDYALVIRIDQPSGEQCLGLAKSKNGLDFDIVPHPILTANELEGKRVNDPRVVFIDDWYYLTYCSDPAGPRLREEGIYLCIARSRDLENWERIYRSQPDNRNAVIFPEKINGLYARLDRPFRRGYRDQAGYDIWISYSPDMEFWGRHQLLLSHYDVTWGSHKIGPGPTPIRTDAGWLVIFHGAFIPETKQPWLDWSCGNCKVYCAGVMLLDLKNPERIIGRCPHPILIPQTDYEMDTSYRPNVVFPCGVIPEPDNSLKIYYGAADSTICLATADIDELVALCRQ